MTYLGTRILDSMKSPTDPPSTPIPPSQFPSRFFTATELAWIDFAFARRAFRMRQYALTGPDPEGTTIVTRQWFALSDVRRKELESRAIRLNTDSFPRCCAFWQYYADNLGNSIINIDQTYLDPAMYNDVLTSCKKSVPINVRSSPQ